MRKIENLKIKRRVKPGVIKKSQSLRGDEGGDVKRGFGIVRLPGMTGSKDQSTLAKSEKENRSSKKEKFGGKKRGGRKTGTPTTKKLLRKGGR